MYSKRYFEDYHFGELKNQKSLCKAVKETGYSIETYDANPMTIRLLIAHDNLKQIICLASQWHTTGPLIINMGNSSPLPMVSGALSYDPIVRPDNHNTKSFNLIEVHKALFGFFSNLNSAMDRLAYEINILYQIEMNKPIIDWAYFFGNAHKDPQKPIPLLKDIVNNHNKQRINWIIECRNRLLHDGILNVELNGSIYLQKYPGDSNKDVKTQMKDECENAYSEIVHTIDEIYGSLLTQIETWGLPLKIR